MVKAYVHSTESFGSVDGPGVRFVIFLQGCHMRCRYCHNPETWKTGVGNEFTADELLAKAVRYRPYWGKEGGITVSGGEPLLQLPFLVELFSKAKAMGISTCLDTSGQPFTKEGPFWDQFQELMRFTGLVLLDIKHIDDEEHKKLTGWSNQAILEMARTLDAMHVPVWIRHVLIPGLTDKDEWLSRLAAFTSELTNVERIEVLPYHTLGTYKWEKLGIPYTLQGIQPPTRERVEHADAMLHGQGSKEH